MVSPSRKISSPARKMASPLHDGMAGDSMNIFHKNVTLFLFLVVVICVLCGYQGALEPKRRVKNMNVSHDLTVDGQSIVSGKALAQPYYVGMTVTTVATAATLTYAANVITVNDYTGSAAQAVTLPAANVGTKVIHYQDQDTTGGVTTLTFTCASGDFYRTGSILLGTVVTGGNTLATSTSGNTIVTFTPVNAATNFVTKGSQFMFHCVSGGIWEVSLDQSDVISPNANPALVVTGTIAFS